MTYRISRRRRLDWMQSVVGYCGEVRPRRLRGLAQGSRFADLGWQGDMSAERAKLEGLDPAFGEQSRDLSSVVDVVRHDPPHRPLSRHVVHVAAPGVAIGDVQIVD